MDSVLRLKGGTEPVFHFARVTSACTGVLGNIWYSVLCQRMLRAARTHTTVMGVPLGASQVVLQHRYFASAHTRVDRWALIEFRNSASPGGVKQLGIVLERKRSLQRSKTKKFSLIVKAENDKLFTIPERDVTYQWPTGVDVADESLLQKTRERINNLMDSVPAAKIQRLWEAHSRRTKAVSIPVDTVSKRLFYSADPLHVSALYSKTLLSCLTS